MKTALTIFVAIVMAIFGWFATPGLGLTGADITDPPVTFVFFLVVFVSCLIWLTAPHFLRHRTSTAWIFYGLASPFVGWLLIAMTLAVFVAHVPIVLIFGFFAALVTVPIGLVTSFMVYLIWKRPDWEQGKQGADLQMSPAPVLKRRERSDINLDLKVRPSGEVT